MVVWSNFAALRENVARSCSDALASDITLKGQLMHQRRISRKCSFFDLASMFEMSNGERERLEVILKVIDDELSVDEIDIIRYRFKVGDIVNVRGFVERVKNGTSILIHARDITVDRAWKDSNPGVSFLPLPTIVKNKRQLINEENQSENNKCSARTSTAKNIDRAAGERVHCKFWINSKSCQHGDRCSFVHVSNVERKMERAKWIEERLLLKRARAHIDEDPLDPHGKIGKQQRAHVFVEWLVETFGSKYLASGGGVVDIAGGRGSVSFELWNKRRLPCTLVEPVNHALDRIQVLILMSLCNANLNVDSDQ